MSGVARHAGVIHNVEFRQHDAVRQHVVVCGKPGLPRHRDECWYLMTDLPYTADTLTQLQSRRMCIGEWFRDKENRRYGWALRLTLIRRQSDATAWY
ncbi:hypothetical protein HRbin36_01731 [bacterium HR36]|nr:hypothetical protein HRbin36_01731 [bacterium HR36]